MDCTKTLKRNLLVLKLGLTKPYRKVFNDINAEPLDQMVQYRPTTDEVNCLHAFRSDVISDRFLKFFVPPNLSCQN